MAKMSNEAKPAAPPTEHTTRKRRKRKRQYTEQIYGARPEYADARIIDEYASRNGLDRAEVVRQALHLFALRQGLKYPAKDALRDMQEQVFREYFAELFERLEAISKTLHELPAEVAGCNTEAPFRFLGAAPDTSSAHANIGETGGEFTARLEFLISGQNRVLEQILLTSTFVLRLLVNYHVDPQLRRLDPLKPESIAPYLLAADQGTASWSAPTVEVMRRTGEKIQSELYPNATKSKSGPPDAARSDAQRSTLTSTDTDISAAL